MRIEFPDYPVIAQYVFDNLRLVYHIKKEDEEVLMKLFVPQREDYRITFDAIRNTEPLFYEWKAHRFPVFIHRNAASLFNDEGLIDFDIFLNIFLFLSGWQEWICEEKDEEGRFSYSSSLQHHYDFPGLPVVNIYYDLLIKQAAAKGLIIQRISEKSQLILTHDIDQLNSGWYEDIGYELRNFSFRSFLEIPKSMLTKLLGGRDSYYQGFGTMIEMENKQDASSLSFFMVRKSSQDSDYQIDKVKELMDLTAGNIGLHPGYHSFNDPDDFKKQLEELEEVSGQKITKVRQHFLRYDVRTTPKIHEQCGIKEDYSLGFARAYGFRNGIADRFYLFDFENQRRYQVVEIPLFFMDGTLSHYLEGDRQKNMDKILELLRQVTENFQFHFSILFHNSVFTEKKYKGFTTLYEAILRLKNATERKA